MDGVDSTWSDAFWDAACTLRETATPYRPSRVSSGAYKRGRVRGIVGVFERSASESSDVGEDEISHPLRFRGASISGSGYESTGDEAVPPEVTPSLLNHDADRSSPRRSGAPTPRPSYVPASPHPGLDLTPQTREVEIVTVTDAEPSMAELYEKTYGVSAPFPNHLASDGGDEDTSLGETVKITAPEGNIEIPTSGEREKFIASPPPAPPSLTDLFVPVPAPLPAHRPAPETHLLMPSPVIADPPAPQRVYVFPPDTDETALRTLDVLKARLELVEGRIAAMEQKDMSNGDVAPPTVDDPVDDTSALWSETRQSAYVLLAGVTAGASVVLVPLLFRHFLTR